MQYAALQDLIDRFGEDEILALTDRARSGEIDPAVVDRALGDACETIDGYVGARYTLPLPTAPAVLTRVACELARFYLYDEAPTELVAKRHDNAIAMLRDLFNGRVSLGISQDEAQPATAGEPLVSQGRSVFDRRTLSDWNDPYGR